MISRTTTLLATSLAFSAVACLPAEGMLDAPVDNLELEISTIVETAASAGDFTTLLAAVEAAGLTETLQDGGPFTVFAPTDAAFAALPDGTVDALLADIPALTDILLYHVVSGELPASAVVEESLVGTLQGSDVKVTLDADVFINEATVLAADVFATNGVIHVIDKVLIPES